VPSFFKFTLGEAPNQESPKDFSGINTSQGSKGLAKTSMLFPHFNIGLFLLMRGGLLTFLVVVHVAAIVLFSRGFLLSRFALANISERGQNQPQPTHKRAVVLVIDSLRFDFVSPNPPEPHNKHYHNVLKLPAQLTKSRPEHSFLFNAYADPPTTTLQRIKALTTGSLPTFIDMGSNFGGSAILEDSIVRQLQLSNRTVSASLVPFSQSHFSLEDRSLLWETILGCPHIQLLFTQT